MIRCIFMFCAIALVGCRSAPQCDKLMRKLNPGKAIVSIKVGLDETEANCIDFEHYIYKVDDMYYVCELFAPRVSVRPMIFSRKLKNKAEAL